MRDMVDTGDVSCIAVLKAYTARELSVPGSAVPETTMFDLLEIPYGTVPDG